MKINQEKNKARIERIAAKKEKRDKQKAEYESSKKPLHKKENNKGFC